MSFSWSSSSLNQNELSSVADHAQAAIAAWSCCGNRTPVLAPPVRPGVSLSLPQRRVLVITSTLAPFFQIKKQQWRFLLRRELW
jgi:hypothetical protein